MNRILVIGATGNTGRHVVSQLTAAGLPVRALVRNPQTAALPPQVEVVRGDLTQPDTLDACLDGIGAVFLVWVAPPTAVAPALQRILPRTPRIVLLSAPFKTQHPAFQAPQPNPITSMQQEIEGLIEASDCQWTFVRPGMLASNTKLWWAGQVRAGDVVRWPYLAAATAPINEHDIAAVAVRALCEDGHAGAEYVITGPQSLTQFEQISILGDVLGRSLRIQEISPDEARNELLYMAPVRIVNMLLDSWAASIGQPAYLTSTVQEVTGAPPRSFRDWVTAHAAEFRA